MSSINQGVSVAVRALDELPKDQRELYSARYMADETREATCQRLGMDPAHYDHLLIKTLRSLRQLAGPAPASRAPA